MSLLFRKMETRRLHGPDMRQLVCVLRNDPCAPVDSDNPPHEKATQDAIKQLPRRLRSTILSSHGLLCHTHKGLDAHLIDDIWAWIKFELEIAVGRFIYPLIITNVLSETDEYRTRQLEPVVEMFLPGWTLAGSAPPGKKPINTGTNWAYQKNGCPACMLARIGSDEKALFALFAGMYGHLRSRCGGQKGVDKIRSKRLRFLRYWMRTHANGDQTAQEAYDLGVHLKTLRPDAKTSLRQSGQSAHYVRNSLDEPLVTARHCLDDHLDSAVDLTPPYNPKDWADTTAQEFDSKVEISPRRDPAAPTLANHCAQEHTPDPLRATIYLNPPTQRSAHSTYASSTLKTDEDKLGPLGQLTGANLHSVPRSFSPSNTFRPTSSIYSSPSRVTSIASYNAPDQPPRRERCHDPMETAEERLNKYRKLMARDSAELGTNDGQGAGGLEWRGRLLPRPSRGSMYAAFGEEGRCGEEFEEVDETPPPSPGAEGGFKFDRDQKEDEIVLQPLRALGNY